MDQISFEPLVMQHFPLLYQWMQEPQIVKWWGEGKTWSLQDIETKYRSYTLGYKIVKGKKKPIFPFVIHLEGCPIGFIQMYNAFDFERERFYLREVWNGPMHSLGALDFYIGEPSYRSKGLGSQSLKIFLKDHVFRLFDACLVDPEKNNKIAIKTYAKAGFFIVHEVTSSTVMIARKAGKEKSPYHKPLVKEVY